MAARTYTLHLTAAELQAAWDAITDHHIPEERNADELSAVAKLTAALKAAKGRRRAANRGEG